MPTDVAGLPLLPLLALIGGVLILIKADLLNWVVALFLIGFGLLGVLPAVGVDVSAVQERVEQIRQGQ